MEATGAIWPKNLKGALCKVMITDYGCAHAGMTGRVDYQVLIQSLELAVKLAAAPKRTEPYQAARKAALITAKKVKGIFDLVGGLTQACEMLFKEMSRTFHVLKLFLFFFF